MKTGSADCEFSLLVKLVVDNAQVLMSLGEMAMR